MTYRYLELMLGCKNKTLDLSNVAVLIPLNSQGEELPCTTTEEDIVLWNRKVISYEIKDRIMYATLDGTGEREIHWR